MLDTESPSGNAETSSQAEDDDSCIYQDIAGYCKAAKLEDIKANDYVFTPGRYVGVAEEEDDGIPFEEKMGTLSTLLKEQMNQSEQLDTDIKNNLKLLGYQ